MECVTRGENVQICPPSSEVCDGDLDRHKEIDLNSSFPPVHGVMRKRSTLPQLSKRLRYNGTDSIVDNDAETDEQIAQEVQEWLQGESRKVMKAERSKWIFQYGFDFVTESFVGASHQGSHGNELHAHGVTSAECNPKE